MPTPPLREVAPVATADRIATIDIVRGIALYGVMAMNVVTGFRISTFQQFLPQVPDPAAINRFVDTALQFAFEMKAFSLFSLLFGVGLAIQYERLSSGGTPLRWLLRRLVVLLVFGLLHLFFIWNGDILTEYALAGLLVLPFLACSRWTVGVASVYCFVFYAVMPFLHLPWPTQDWFHEHVAAANAAYRHGGFSVVAQFNFHEIRDFVPLHLGVFPRTLGLFLLGAWIWRGGLLRNPAEHRLKIACAAVIGLTAGTLLTTCDVMNLITPHSALAALRGPISKIAAPTLAVGYGAALVWLAAFTSSRRPLSAFGPLGRMAFTNYILQSIVFSLVFFGYGVGLAGRIGSAAALLVGTSFYVLQMIMSAWWLRRYRFGPLEWLWRTLMYGKSQPMVIGRTPIIQAADV